MENQIYNILNDMTEFLNVMQMKKLQKVLIYHLNEAKQVQEEISNEKYLEMFLTAKQIEGCSDRTIQYYRVTIEHMLKRITIPLRQIATEDIRQYLIDYQKINNCGKVTIDNIRRNLSSFFSWLEEEDHILKSPVKRIHKIKTKTVVKEVISDESIEILRDNCKEKRDLAIIDLLFSTGMRVGELVNLDIADIDFNERECIVYGKGDKERRIQIGNDAVIHILEEYKNNYLFEIQNCKHFFANQSGNPLSDQAVRRMINKYTSLAAIDLHITPHMFRHTFATCLLEADVDIRYIQEMLGHSSINITQIYTHVAVAKQKDILTTKHPRKDMHI